MPAPQEETLERPRVPHRSWRELPPTPPLGVPLPPPAPTTQMLVTDTAPQPAPGAPPRKRGRRILAAGLGAVVGAAAVAGVFALASDDDDESGAAPIAGATAPGEPEVVQDVVSAVAPAVVEIGHGAAVGSGVIYDDSGLVLTAHHVVAGTETVTVKTADGQTLSGTVVGRAPERDLAIVAVEAPDGVPAADLAAPDSVEVGETAIAMGSPFGFSASVTSGIISGLDRSLPVPGGELTGLIQTDAPINPGNSGGPLVDADSKVIGINTAIASTTGGSNGVGFAIPVADAQSLMDEVEAAGGVDAPAVPDDGSGFELPGLGQIPGLDQLPDLGQIPGLEDIPGLDELLNGDPSEALQQLLDELLGGQELFPAPEDQAPNVDPGTDPSTEPDEETEQSAPILGLITLGELPDGYAQERNQIATTSTGSGVEGHQTIVLRGPRGLVTIEAERGDQAGSGYEDLNGDPTEVNGQEAKEITGGVALLIDDDLLVKVTGDTFVVEDDVTAIAEAVEVVE